MSTNNGDSVPFLYMCMPCYSHPHGKAAKQFWARSCKPDGPNRDLRRIMDDSGNSLLGSAFDWHWAYALNLQRQGVAIRWFAMLHADVVPSDWWLDQLLSDLQETGADVMAACIAIKDTQGLTSTAIDDPDDDWDVLRRLSVSEITKLPAVFSAADCGYPDQQLLVNTGCWVCDFTRPWRHARNPDGTLAVNFEIRNCIRPYFDKQQNLELFETRVRPEDWEFSRKVGRLGGKVMVTRRVQVNHMGEFPWPNDGYWGIMELDESLRQKGKFSEPIKADVPLVEGWLTEAEGRLLARHARGKTVLEIGSWCGKSTVWMARECEQIHCIDIFTGMGTARPRDTFDDFRSNIRKYQVEDKVTVHRCLSTQALHNCPRIFDFAFIDGSHDALHVAQDVQVVLRLLKPQGRIAFHDYGSKLAGDEGVHIVVDELLANGFDAVDKADSILVIQLAATAETTVENGSLQAV